jgi:hypothetical protein
MMLQLQTAAWKRDRWYENLGQKNRKGSMDE